MDIKTQKLLAKKTLTPAEVPLVFAALSATKDGLEQARRHSNRGVRRLALHFMHRTPISEAVPTVLADAPSAPLNDAPIPLGEPVALLLANNPRPRIEVPAELFFMNRDAEVSWISETCGISFSKTPSPIDILAQKFPMFTREVIEKVLSDKGSADAAARSLAAKRANLAKHKAAIAAE